MAGALTGSGGGVVVAPAVGTGGTGITTVGAAGATGGAATGAWGNRNPDAISARCRSIMSRNAHTAIREVLSAYTRSSSVAAVAIVVISG